MIDYIPWLLMLLLSLLRRNWIQNLEENEKLKDRYRNMKDESLVLPKE